MKKYTTERGIEIGITPIPLLLDQIRNDERLKDTRVMVATADSRMAEDLHEQADLVLLKPIGYIQLRDLATRLRVTKPPTSLTS